MSQILLIDFSDEDVGELKKEGYDVELKNTNWVSGDTEPLIPPEDCKIIFYNADDDDPASSIHIDDTKYFKTLISSGSVMVCFVGKTRDSHITNLTGIPFSNEVFSPLSNPSKIEVAQDSPFTPIFSRLGGLISRCAALLWKASLEENGTQVIARHKETETSVAACFKYKKGFFVLLPYFGDGEFNIDVIELLLNEILPAIKPDLFEDKENKWLQDSRYYVPNLIDLHAKRKSVQKEYADKIKKIEKKIKEVQDREQDTLNKLLTSKEDPLKETVLHWFKYIGFTVIDVDKYWESLSRQKKEPSRQKEEDIWLFQENKPNVSKDELILVEVKSRSTKGASDNNVGVIERYKSRRMKEFGHTNMKGLLIGNYFFNKPAHRRKLPFSDNQVKDAERDENALLTTYDLFKVIRMEKEKKLSKNDIRAKIMSTNGVIKWDKPKSGNPKNA